MPAPRVSKTFRLPAALARRLAAWKRRLPARPDGRAWTLTDVVEAALIQALDRWDAGDLPPCHPGDIPPASGARQGRGDG